MKLDFSLQQKQVQTLKLSQKMIQSITMLTMPSADLREYIYGEVEKNPALEIVQDGTDDVLPRLPQPQLREWGATGNSASSDAFQAFLESRPAPESGIKTHLLEQFVLLPLNDAERALGKKIIGNLDRKGFHREPPENLLDPAVPGETPACLERCLLLIRQLDPVGAACTDSAESLLVQARMRQNAPPLALFFLDGRLDLLDTNRVQTLIKAIEKERDDLLPKKITAEQVEAALDFIRTLEPFPARGFPSESTIYISPDVFVTKNAAKDAVNDATTSETGGFSVRFADSLLPHLELSPLFDTLSLKNHGADKTNASQFASSYVRDAKWFIDTIRQREKAIVKTVQAIIEAQLPFFEKGQRFLLPLRMKDIAKKVGVHEATISRIANGKYLQCEWGFFEIRYFFSNKVSQDSVQDHSKESVKQELLAILTEDDAQFKRQLTDEILVKKLAERGITIARRTVAKYRAELNINSSFSR